MSGAQSAPADPAGLLQAFSGEAGGEWEWLKAAVDKFAGQELVAQKQAASDGFEALEGMTPQAFEVTSRLKNGASIADRDLELRNRLYGEAREAWSAYCGARDRAQLDLWAKLAFGQLLALGREGTRRAEEALIPVQVWAFLKFCFEEGDVARSKDDKDPMVYYFVRVAAVGGVGSAPVESTAAEPLTVQKALIVRQPLIEGTAEPNKGTEKLPPFDAKKTMVLFVAQKVSGVWRQPPTEDELRAFLKKHFSGVPNDPHRALRHKAWPGQIRRGPKRKSIVAD